MQSAVYAYEENIAIDPLKVDSTRALSLKSCFALLSKSTVGQKTLPDSGTICARDGWVFSTHNPGGRVMASPPWPKGTFRLDFLTLTVTVTGLPAVTPRVAARWLGHSREADSQRAYGQLAGDLCELCDHCSRRKDGQSHPSCASHERGVRTLCLCGVRGRGCPCECVGVGVWVGGWVGGGVRSCVWVLARCVRLPPVGLALSSAAAGMHVWRMLWDVFGV